jgi:CBS domain-containing protein
MSPAASTVPSGLPRQMTASSLMTADVVTVTEKTQVNEAARILVERRVSNAPVIQVDFTRRLLVGFVSEKDVLQCFASGKLYDDPQVQVREIMRPHPICVRPETDVVNLAAIFMQHDFRHLPVTQAGMLLGMVSRRDVLTALMADLRSWYLQDPATRQRPDVGRTFAPHFLLG